MGGKELAVINNKGLNLREVAARATLRDIRLRGHVYVELRQVGKRTIFFCTLCQTQCFNDAVLNDHLKGNLHARRYAAAEVTLFGPSPWPFSDGVLFFNASSDNGFDGDEVSANGSGVILALTAGNGKEVVNGCKKSVARTNGLREGSKYNGVRNYLVVPGVLFHEEITEMRFRFIGYGHIGARFNETDEGRMSINRIWCGWLGNGESDSCKPLLSPPKCEFAVVTLGYTYELGRKATLDELEAHGSFFLMDDLGRPRKKKKKSFSDPEDSSDSRNDQLSGCSEVASSQLCDSRLMPSRSLRRELRKHKRLTAERTCDICGQPMLPGKDVSTLLNLNTGRLACSSRNVNGAFHLFHTSCLIHWILLCEFEAWNGKPTKTKTTRGRKSKSAQKKCVSIFCPECQGTGIPVEGDEMEKPTVPLPEIFLHKLKVIEAHKAWMKNPEDVKICSTGLHFPSNTLERLQVQDKVMPLKLLHFYRTDE